MSFFAVIAAHAKGPATGSYAFKEWALPDGFACFLSPTSGQKEFWRSFFTVASAIESATAAGPSGYDTSVVLNKVFWWRWPLIEWLVHLLEPDLNQT